MKDDEQKPKPCDSDDDEDDDDDDGGGGGGCGWWMVVTMMVTIFLNSSRAGISTPMLVQCQALKEHGSGLIEVQPGGMTDQSSFFSPRVTLQI